MKYRPICLGVNIDHVASLRQARGTRYPEPLYAALLAEESGADSITVHLREDRRHIQQRDVEMLRNAITTKLNLEMAATSEMIDFAIKIKPDFCCLVPEKRHELTTEGGLDVLGQFYQIQSACDQLVAAGIRVSLFIDADVLQVDAVNACNAPMIEIHTGAYADASEPTLQFQEWQKIQNVASYAHQQGLQVNAGHGLHYHNVQSVAAIPEIVELNIGHAIIARAIFVGMKAAVMEMKQLMLAAGNPDSMTSPDKLIR